MQIAEYVGGRRQRIVEHLGSAHSEAELGLLLERACGLLADGRQGILDLGLEPTTRAVGLVPAPGEPALLSDQPAPSQAPRVGPARVESTASRVLFDVLAGCSPTWGSTGSVTRCSRTW